MSSTTHTMKRSFLIYCLALLGNVAAFAQVRHLSLEQSAEIAKEQSFTMRKLQQDLKMAEYNLQSVTRSLKTHIDLSLTLPSYEKTIMQNNDSSIFFYSKERVNYAGDLSITQPLLTNGRLYIATGLGIVDDFNAKTRHTSLDTYVGLSQPLDALYGYNAIKSTLKRAELAYERTSKTLKRSELMLVSRVSNSYYNLLSLQKSMEIAQLDLERQTEAYEISKNKYESGLIREVDALQMEVDLAEAQSGYDMAVLNLSSANNSFKELIGIPLTDSIVLDSELTYEIVVVDPEEAVRMALENRLEIRESEIQMILQELEIKRQKAQGMVKANLEAAFGRVGAIGGSRDKLSILNSIDYTFADFKSRPASFSVGLKITIPILDWGENRALVRSTQAQHKRLAIEREELLSNIEVSIRNLVAKISSNLKRLQLLEKNVGVAEKSFAITLSRFTDGDIDSQALALERNRLNNAYRTHLGAYIEYQLSLADLTEQTFYDFRLSKLVK